MYVVHLRALAVATKVMKTVLQSTTRESLPLFLSCILAWIFIRYSQDPTADGAAGEVSLPTSCVLFSAKAEKCLAFHSFLTMNGLRLDVSIGRERYDAMEETYRNEGLSVGVDHMV